MVMPVKKWIEVVFAVRRKMSVWSLWRILFYDNVEKFAPKRWGVVVLWNRKLLDVEAF